MNQETSGGYSETSSDDTSSVTKTPFIPIINKVPGELNSSQPLGNVKFDKHKIKLNVSLYHNGEKFDLTPYVLQVKTHMAIGEPAGRFTLLMNFKKRWDRFVFAMDYIEISFSRYLDDPPIMMRGFVGNVRRTRIADSTGKVHRAYTINGENFGKIWSNYYIEYLVQEVGQTLQGFDIGLTTSTDLIFPMLSENYGIASSVPASGNILNSDLVNGFIDKMLNPYINVLRLVTPQIPTLIPAISTQSYFQITNTGLIQKVENQNVYDVMNQFGNRPWCEYFIDDFSNGPVLFYRDAPFKDDQGNLILDASNPSVGTLADYYMHPKIDDTHIIEEDVGVSDNEVYSYFFTYPAIFMYAQVDPRAIILGKTLSLAQEMDTSNIYNPHIEADNLNRFGFKSLQIASNSIPLSADQNGLSQDAIALANTMNSWLTKAFRWSHKMINGTIKLKGNEHLRIGRYVTQTSTQEEFYIESVDHEITVSQIGSLGNDNVYQFTTTIGVTRGRDVSNDN